MNAEKHTKLTKIMNTMSEEDKNELLVATQELMDRCMEFKHGLCQQADVDIAARIYQRLVSIKLAKTEREIDVFANLILYRS